MAVTTRRKKSEAKRTLRLAWPDTNSIMKQLLRALEFMHPFFFHRDLKPENMMCNQAGTHIKLIDFGQGKEVRSRPPITDYVGTRWYRAPEVLLQGTVGEYNSPVDLWSAGCIMAELIEMRALFPGASQVDQGYRLVQVLGHPTQASWPSGHRSASHIKVAADAATHLAAAVPKATAPQLCLLTQLLQWDPHKRPTAHNALEHGCFDDTPDVANLDPRKRRSSMTHDAIHEHHIAREVSEQEGGRMTSVAAAMMTLRAINKFKQAIPRFQKNGRKGQKPRQVSSLLTVVEDSAAADGGTGAGSCKPHRSSIFDMEAAMDAISHEIGCDDASAGGEGEGGDGGGGDDTATRAEEHDDDDDDDDADDFHGRFAVVRRLSSEALHGFGIGNGTMRVFCQKSTLEDAIGSHACSREALTYL
jgi:serine/threonine protein kinase